jgi:integrase
MVKDIIREYERSPNFTRLSDATKQSYSLYLGHIIKAFGHREIDSITRKEVATYLSGKKPGAHNLILSIFRVVFGFAIDRGYLDTSPADRIKRHHVGAWTAWPYADLMKIIHNPRCGASLAACLAFYTAQRLSDVLAMDWSDYDGTHLHVTQSKTGTKLRLPVVGPLKAVLDPIRSTGPIVTINGGGIDRSKFYYYFRTMALSTTGKYYPFHGIRKTSAQRMAESGATPHQISSITGHKSLREIERYTREANQKEIAEKAIGHLT